MSRVFRLYEFILVKVLLFFVMFFDVTVSRNIVLLDIIETYDVMCWNRRTLSIF